MTRRVRFRDEDVMLYYFVEIVDRPVTYHITESANFLEPELRKMKATSQVLFPDVL